MIFCGGDIDSLLGRIESWPGWEDNPVMVNNNATPNQIWATVRWIALLANLERRETPHIPSFRHRIDCLTGKLTKQI